MIEHPWVSKEPRGRCTGGQTLRRAQAHRLTEYPVSGMRHCFTKML